MPTCNVMCFLEKIFKAYAKHATGSLLVLSKSKTGPMSREWQSKAQMEESPYLDSRIWKSNVGKNKGASDFSHLTLEIQIRRQCCPPGAAAMVCGQFHTEGKGGKLAEEHAQRAAMVPSLRPTECNRFLFGHC